MKDRYQKKIKTENLKEKEIQTHFFDSSLKITYIIVAAIVIFYCIIRSNFWEIAMERDEGIYIYFGKLILQGKIPYNDFYEIRFPGIFYMYALIVSIFGYSAKGVAIGFTVVNAISALVIFFIAKIWSNKNYIGLIATIVFCILSLYPFFSGFTRQSEHLVNFFFILSLFFSVLASSKKIDYLYIATGVALCMAILIKPNAIYFTLPIVYISFFSDFENTFVNIKSSIKNIMFLAIGGTLPLLFFGLILWKNNALENFYQFAIIEAGKYAKGIEWNIGKQMFLGIWNVFYTDYKIIIIASFVVSILIWFTKLTWKLKILVSLLILSAWLSITPGLRFYNHYWIMLIPVLAISFALFIFSITNIIEQKTSKNFIQYFIVVLSFIFLSFQIIKNKSYYFNTDETELMRKTYGINPFPEIKYIGNFLNERKKPNDKITLIGSEPELYVYTNMDAATRHPYFSYLMVDTTLTPKVKQWQEEFFEDLKKNKPKFIIFTNQVYSIGAVKNSNFKFFDNFYPIVAPLYKQIGLIDMIDEQTIQYYFDEKTVGQQVPANKQQCIYILERAID